MSSDQSTVDATEPVGRISKKWHGYFKAFTHGKQKGWMLYYDDGTEIAFLTKLEDINEVAEAAHVIPHHVS